MKFDEMRPRIRRDGTVELTGGGESVVIGWVVKRSARVAVITYRTVWAYRGLGGRYASGGTRRTRGAAVRALVDDFRKVT